MIERLKQEYEEEIRKKLEEIHPTLPYYLQFFMDKEGHAFLQVSIPPVGMWKEKEELEHMGFVHVGIYADGNYPECICMAMKVPKEHLRKKIITVEKIDWRD